MASSFDSERLREVAKALKPGVEPLLLFFPDMEWNLKRAGYDMNASQYLAIILFVSILTFFLTLVCITVPFIYFKAEVNAYVSYSIPFVVSIFTFFYLYFTPKIKIMRDARLIDKDLEYMLKDMQIQLTAGVPLFNTIANIGSGGYGECSRIASDIVHGVESGNSMQDVLNTYGMLSPSNNMKRAFWQISNALQTGSDIKLALAAISDDIRREKENKIKIYGQELSLWALMYMMFAIILPSMGITLLLILSSFFGGGIINKNSFWVILGFVVAFQFMFISLIRSKRPDV